MEIPKQYTVIYKDAKGNNKHRETNEVDTADKWKIKYDGVTWIDTRYKAKLRLYWYLWRKKEYKTDV